MVHYTRVQGPDRPADRGARGGARRPRRRRPGRLRRRHARPQSAGLWTLGARCCARSFRPPARAKRSAAGSCGTPLPAAEQVALVDAVAAAAASAGVRRAVRAGRACSGAHHELLAADRGGVRSAAAGASTCISSRPATSATGPTAAYRRRHRALSRRDRPRRTRGSRSRIAPGLRPDELDLIAERGATIVVNTSSNLSRELRPRAGRARCLRRGCRVATRPRRPCRSTKMKMPCGRCGSPTSFYIAVRASTSGRRSRATLLRIAFENGRASAVTGATDGGRIAAGAAGRSSWSSTGTSCRAELVAARCRPAIELLLARTSAAGTCQTNCSSTAGRSCATARSPASTCRRCEAELLATLRKEAGTTRPTHAELRKPRCARIAARRFMRPIIP